jgi:hypothetical protein
MIVCLIADVESCSCNARIGDSEMWWMLVDTYADACFNNYFAILATES